MLISPLTILAQGRKLQSPLEDCSFHFEKNMKVITKKVKSAVASLISAQRQCLVTAIT
jgi:hypothetical protein